MQDAKEGSKLGRDEYLPSQKLVSRERHLTGPLGLEVNA